MSHLGVVEGFFGPPWATRKTLAPFLAEHGFDFYIYAPKADKNLRREWTSAWSVDYVAELRDLSQTFRAAGVRFGVGLSPFGISQMPWDEVERNLRDRLKALNEIGIDLIGIFFDDMKVHEDLAAKQIAVLEIVRTATRAKIIFCPTFYTFDPLLDRVFGARPAGYLEEIAKLPLDIEIAWTGPLVISAEISATHIREVTALLRRPPFIWDNLFANDGPKNCKFLKFRSPEGRAILPAVNGMGINPMNQLELAKVALLAMKFATQGVAGEAALRQAIGMSCSEKLAAFLTRNLDLFRNEGLDKITAAPLLAELTEMNEPVAQDIKAWLRGEYLVGSECLTD